MNSLHTQFEAILAVPIGGAVIACALGFFGLAAGVVKFVIGRQAERRAMIRDLAERMPSTRLRSVGESGPSTRLRSVGPNMSGGGDD